MYDSIELGQIPADPFAVGAYVNGAWATAVQAAQLFPHARVLTIAVTAGADAEALDVETGDAAPADAPAWSVRQRGRGVARPCLYADASTMETGIVPLVRSGALPRALVRLWSAHYTGTAHICSPASCGLVSIGMDGTQWTDRAMGRNLDQSLLLADFFGAVPAPEPKPAPPAAPPTVPAPWREWTTAGMDSLAGLAGSRGAEVSTVLRVTAERSPGSVFTPEVSQYLNRVFAGEVNPSAPMPAGLRLWVPG
jgi:hypothetical protein